MAKVKGNKAVLNNTEEKIVTKYDKKVQKKQEQEKRDAKAKKITSIAATVILVIIVAVAGTAAWMNYDPLTFFIEQGSYPEDTKQKLLDSFDGEPIKQIYEQS